MRMKRLILALKSLPSAHCSIVNALEQPSECLPSWLWTRKCDTDSVRDRQFCQVFRFILTDFANICTSTRTAPRFDNSERSFMTDHIAPIFNAFGKQTDLLTFNWGEIQLKQQSRIMVTYRTNPVQLRFVDGLGYDDKDNERLVAEMSGGANIDNGQHAADDTLKVIHSLTCILKADARNCPRASISTFKKLKAFGVQTVQTTMILPEMYIDDDLKFVYKESRKAIVPRNYGQRQKQFAMAEMLA